MVKKAVIFLVLLLLFVLPVSAATGVISISAPAGSELTLYRVGKEEGGQIVFTEDFAPSRIILSQIHDPQGAALLAAFAQKHGISGAVRTCDEEELVWFEDLQQGIYLVAQTKTAKGFAPITPFLFSIPQGDCYAVEAAPKRQAQEITTAPETLTPKTGDQTQVLLFPAAAAAVFSFAGLVLCLISQKNRR